MLNGANRGLKVVVHLLNKFGVGQTKWSTFMYTILGQGRKSGGARATGAKPSLAPLHMLKSIYKKLVTYIGQISPRYCYFVY